MTKNVQTEVPVENVKADDIYTSHKGQTMVIGDVKVGTKWVTARTASGKLAFELVKGSTVAITRTVPTEEELAEQAANIEAQRRARSNENLQAWITDRTENLEQTLVRLATKIADGLSAYGLYGDMMVAQAEAKIAAEINHIQDIGNSEGRNEDYWGPIVERGQLDATGAFELWAEQQKEKFTSRYAVKALSRSTSVVSNLLEDVETETRLTILDKGRWGMWL
jgi:hypothetical protein